MSTAEEPIQPEAPSQLEPPSQIEAPGRFAVSSRLEASGWLEASIASRFWAVVAAHPDRPALAGVTYAELGRQVRGVAAAVRGAKRVALLLDHGRETIAGILGTLSAGAAYVPLDPRYPAVRLSRMAALADADVVLTSPAHRNLATELLDDTQIVDITTLPTLPALPGLPGPGPALSGPALSGPPPVVPHGLPHPTPPGHPHPNPNGHPHPNPHAPDPAPEPSSGIGAEDPEARSSEGASRADGASDWVPVDPGAPAYILFTSGSTGQPKGVVQTHRGVLFQVATHTHNLRIGPDDRVSVLSSYSFDMAVTDTFSALLNGACVVPVDVRSEGLTALADAARNITIYHSTPTVFRYLTDSLATGERLDTVRAIILGGEAVVGADLDRFRQHFGDSCVFVNGYGATEISFAIQNHLSQSDAAHAGPGVVPIGFPLPGTQITLEPTRTPEDGNTAERGGTTTAKRGAAIVAQAGGTSTAEHDGAIVAEGGGAITEFEGQIVIRSRYLADYWCGSPSDLARFGTDPDGTRFYQTGDLGRRLPDGRIAYLGRLDRQVKVRGHRVELGEIEAALAVLPGVSKAAVMAKGERLLAYVITSGTTTGMREALSDVLPEYMLPTSITALDTFPLTPTGKVDTAALPPPTNAWQPSAGMTGEAADARPAAAADHPDAMATRGAAQIRPLGDLAAAGQTQPLGDVIAAGLPRPDESVSGGAPDVGVAGGTPDEGGTGGAPDEGAGGVGVGGVIADVWCAVLEVPEVGWEQNFFDAGGYSLLMAKVQQRLEAKLGHRLPLTTLYSYPTITSLARHLTQLHPAVAPTPALAESPALAASLALAEPPALAESPATEPLSESAQVPSATDRMARRRQARRNRTTPP